MLPIELSGLQLWSVESTKLEKRFIFSHFQDKQCLMLSGFGHKSNKKKVDINIHKCKLLRSFVEGTPLPFIKQDHILV